METVYIYRTPSCSAGTLGVIFKRGLFSALTLEPIEPIPAGKYIASRCMHHPGTPGQYEVYGLKNVLGHTNIHMHIGDTIFDTAGCILMGDHIDDIQTKDHGIFRGINLSKDTFAKFMRETSGDIMLVIKDAA